MGKSCFLSSSNRGVGPPRVAVGNTGLLLLCSRILRAPIKVQQEFSVPLEMQHGIQGYTQAVAGILGFLSNCDREPQVSPLA